MRIATRSFRSALLPTLALLAAACSDPSGPKQGSLAVLINGLPAATSAQVTVTGPGQFSRTLSATDTLEALTPGSYTVTIASVTVQGSVYSSSWTSQAVTVSAGSVASSTVAYSLSTGSIALSILGLPSGSAGRVDISGVGVAQTVTTTDTIRGLKPGTYSLVPVAVRAGVHGYDVPAGSQIVTVSANEKPVPVEFTYAISTGSLRVRVSNFPATGSPSIMVVSSKFAIAVQSRDTLLEGIPAGSYEVRSNVSTIDGARYASDPRAVTVNVEAGLAVAEAVLTYAPAPPVNFTIAGAYITQSVQRLDGSIPLVRNRDGLLRVFVTADDANTAQPVVRVRLFDAGGTEVRQATLAAPAASVPTVVNADVESGSYNLRLPASLIQPGLAMRVELDPDNVLVEGSETDNVFPASGTRTFAFKTSPTLLVSIVPIQDTTNKTPSTVPDLDSLLVQTRRMHPIETVSSEVHAVYTTNIAPFTTSSSSQWISLLGEVDALRVAEGTQRMYFGLVKVKYNSGIAGIGYVNGGNDNSPTALGWDYAGGGTAYPGHASSVMAHELGHNWGRRHAPCGGVAGADPAFPYEQGRVGHAGWNMSTGQVIGSTATDLMGYCSNVWISDYTYQGVQDFRAAYSFGVASTTAASQPTLLVWGRVRADGGVVLEPAFELTSRPALPRRAGSHAVRGLAADGRVLFSYAFEPQEIADVPDGDRIFSFAIPLRDADRGALARIEVAGPKGRQTRALSAATTGAGDVRLERGAGRARVKWDGRQHAMALIRDAATGQVLAFARDGSAVIAAPRGGVEVTFADRVGRTRAEAARVRVP